MAAPAAGGAPGDERGRDPRAARERTRGPLARALTVAAALALACATSRERGPAQAPRAPEQEAPAPAPGTGPEATDRPAERAETEPGAEPHGPAAGPPPAPPERRDPSDASPPATAAAVRDAVRAAALARGETVSTLARALRALAGMLERDAEGSPAAVAAVARMRGEVAALERLARIDLDRADRVKAALGRGVEALRAILRGGRAGRLDAWVEAAAAAVDAVDAATPLGLQRAAVQDALRALADAAILADERAR